MKNLKNTYLYSLISLIVLGIFLILRKKKTPREIIEANILASGYSKLTPYIVAMAQVESANFTSNLFRRYNNAFGMNCVSLRPNKQNGCSVDLYDGGMHKGSYRSVKHSTLDLIDWLNYTNFPRSVPSVYVFANELKNRGYFQTPLKNYVNALNSYL